jgi:type III protein arginine methyltransferase
MKDDLALVNRAFEPLVAAAKGNARALLTLARTAQDRGDNRRSYDLVQDAIALEPDNPDITENGRRLLANTVPNWHFNMMKDEARNHAFQAAIERAVQPGMKVLDIGSGSGLLAMIAARAGAETVHSCEMNPVIAGIAREIIAHNGYADQITVHSTNSAKLDPDADMGGQADLVISEIIGNDLVCEAVLPSMLDAARRLAKPGAQFVPKGGEVRVALALNDQLPERVVDSICGFDVSLFNRLETQPARMNVSEKAIDIRGEHASLFDFDFSRNTPATEQTEMDLIATGGTANGVVQWFRLTMDAQDVFENGPEEGSRSWSWIFFPFAEPMHLAPGDVVRVAASVADNHLRIWQK